MKTTILLPAFRGFYGSLFEDADTSSELQYINDCRVENGLEPLENDDTIDWDWEQYFVDISKVITDTVEKFLIDINMVKRIDFTKIISPREYNYVNDKIEATAELNVKEIKGYINANIDEFDKFVKDNFTSRSGFWSFYSDDSIEWVRNMKKFKDLNDVEIQYILSFICMNEGFELEDEVYNGMNDVPYCPCAKNINELTIKN